MRRLSIEFIVKPRAKWLRWLSKEKIVGYKILDSIAYFSNRYKRWITVEEGFISDGGSGPATDITSMAWIIHDKLCTTWAWDDGSKCSNFQAALVLHDILKSEGRWFRARSWFIATWAYGPLRLFKCFR